MRVPGFDQAPQGFIGAEQVLLAVKILQPARAHAVGQGGKGPVLCSRFSGKKAGLDHEMVAPSVMFYDAGKHRLEGACYRTRHVVAPSCRRHLRDASNGAYLCAVI